MSSAQGGSHDSDADGHGATRPGDLQYRTFAKHVSEIEFPSLRIARIKSDRSGMPLPARRDVTPIRVQAAPMEDSESALRHRRR
jgi:hypothetical protein